MIVLGLETSMRGCAVAVFRANGGAGELFRARHNQETGNADALMPIVERVMAQAGIKYDQLDRIAVATGPGTFTGIRVGVAAARALALATGAQVIGIPSLEVIARQMRETQNGVDTTYAVACDARRGEVYFAVYDAGGVVVQKPAVFDAGAAAALLKDVGQVVIAGSGAELVVSAAPDCKAEVLPGDWLPDAGTLARMAVEFRPSGAPVEPLYLRAPDARPQPSMALPRQS